MRLLEPFAVALGSNRGDSRAVLRQAVAKLSGERGVGRLRVSPLYITQAVDTSSGRDFLNAVFSGQTEHPPETLLEILHRIEREAGRTADQRSDGPPHPDRVLDLDLLFCNRRIRTGAPPFLPHPRMTGRRFVLEPLARACPGFVHPETGRSIGDLLSSLPDTPWVRLEKENWL